MEDLHVLCRGPFIDHYGMLMTKFLLAILLIAFALKGIPDSVVLDFKHGMFKLNLTDEAGKSEKPEQEESTNTKKSGSDKDEKYHSHDFGNDTLANLIAILPSQTHHHKPHRGFINRPYTPPNLL
jgi:hypothetical protein